MNNTEQKLAQDLGALKTVKLDVHERDMLRARISVFMQSLPVRNVELSRHQVREGRVSTRPALNHRNKNTMIGIIIAGLFALSGGVSFAAEGALPSDALYPVKIHVNENIKGAFHVGAKANADFARTQLLWRAEEAKKLAEEQRLDVEAKATLQAKIKAHVGDFDKAKAEMEESDDDEGAEKSDEEMRRMLQLHGGTFIDIGLVVEQGVIVGTGGSSTEQGTNELRGVLRVRVTQDIHSTTSAVEGGAKSTADVGGSVNFGTSASDKHENDRSEIDFNDDIIVDLGAGLQGAQQKVDVKGSETLKVGI